MLENLTAYQPIEINPTPHNMRSVSITPRDNMQLQAQIIIGHDPMKRRITHKNCPALSQRSLPRSYNLQFPYGIFWFALHGNKLQGVEGESMVWNPRGWGYVWMKEPFVNLDQLGWTPQMPNLFGDSRICFGANSVNGSLPLGHYIDQSIATFWTSEFNQDLDNGYPYPSLRQWEEAPDNDWPNWSMFAGSGGLVLKDKFQRFEEDMRWDEPVPDGTEGAIPPLPTYSTFSNLANWLDNLQPEQRDRLRATMEMNDE
jgi:hypothetical protein